MAAVCVAAAVAPRATPRRFCWFVAVAAVLPDLDALFRPFGGPDVAFLGGHRAFTHSLLFAAVLGLIIAAGAGPIGRGIAGAAQLWLAASLAIATHGMLDACTTYGEGLSFCRHGRCIVIACRGRYWATDRGAIRCSSCCA